jgi:hypothetical protein
MAKPMKNTDKSLHNQGKNIMKKALFALLAALPLAAFSAEGMSDDLKRFFSGLTAAERDNLGREAAREMQQKNMNKNMDAQYSHIRILDTRYRSSDDTFVISAKTKPGQDSIINNFQSTAEREIAQIVRSEMCARADTRDLMTIGRYAFEYRITTAQGKKFKPVRISAKDCR